MQKTLSFVSRFFNPEELGSLNGTPTPNYTHVHTHVFDGLLLAYGFFLC